MQITLSPEPRAIHPPMDAAPCQPGPADLHALVARIAGPGWYVSDRPLPARARRGHNHVTGRQFASLRRSAARMVQP